MLTSVTASRNRFRRGRSPAVNPPAMAASAIFGMSLGALLAYFLDPKAGRRRRHSGAVSGALPCALGERSRTRSGSPAAR